MSLRHRSVLAATAVVALAAGTLAASAATSPMSPSDAAAVAAYAALHGSLGHVGFVPAPPPYSAPGMGPTPQLPCGPGSRPESGRQGRVPPADYASGRAAKGFTCNLTDIGHEGNSGGFQV